LACGMPWRPQLLHPHPLLLALAFVVATCVPYLYVC
jgi:hypothetical protein